MDQTLRHDLLTPVNHILGYGEMLQEEAEALGQPTPIELTGKILETGKALHALIQSVRPDDAGHYLDTDLQGFRAQLPVLLETLRVICSDLQSAFDPTLASRVAKDIDRIVLASSRLQELNENRIGKLLSSATN